MTWVPRNPNPANKDNAIYHVMQVNTQYSVFVIVEAMCNQGFECNCTASHYTALHCTAAAECCCKMDLAVLPISLLKYRCMMCSFHLLPRSLLVLSGWRG